MNAQLSFEITGHTRVLGILADPIAHVKAPAGINAIARRRGRDAVMVPFQVAPDRLSAWVASLRDLKSFDGAVVTVPHKVAIVGLCDRVSDRARAIGAANVIRRAADGSLEADMLDGAGFVAGLRGAGIEPRDKAAYLVGAGGAANAIAFALAEAGVARLTLANRTLDKAEDLAARVRAAFPGVLVKVGTADPSGHDLVVNGTSLGMRSGDSFPLDAAWLAPQMVVAEVIMEPAETALLAAARAVGCRVHPGRPMLDHQLELMADYFGL
ncbi:shikimate dehydrogenase family protein [Xanthobacter autotrophicus]|uniref:shikimate dehydrogenase family protein n=1 Tax=Xanthobacter autotrophicus TaxID=280 RepID=UPI00372BFF90